MGQPAPQAETEITVRKPISQEIEAAHKAVFLFRTGGDEVVRGTVAQKGSDLMVRVIPENGRWTAEFDNVFRLENSESFEFVTDDSGVYRIEVEAKRGTPKGAFELTVNEPTTADERDRKIHRARTLLFEAASHARAGKYSDAIRVAEEVFAIREEVFGPVSQETAIIVNRLGIYNANAGEAARSFEYTKRALAIYEAIPETDPLVLADVLNNLGVGLRLRGDFVASEHYFQRVIELRERAFGPDGLPLASTLNNLGLLYRSRGDYEAAERTYLRSLRIREKHLAPDHADIGFVLINLAALAFYKGDYSAALELDRRVMEIRRKSLPAGHPLLAEGVYDIALLLNRLGDRENGEKMLLESLELHEKAFKPDAIQLVKPLSTLGSFYRESGDLKKARGLLNRALSIARVFEKADPIELAHALLFSARLHILENDLAAAESELIESLAIREGILGSEHIDVRDTLNTLAGLYAIRGLLSKAVEAQSRANQIGERHLSINLNFGTEHQRQSFASLLGSDLEQTLAIHTQLAENDPKLREMAATMLVQRKGRVLDATAGSLASVRSHLKPESTSLLTQLSDTTAQLSALMVSGPRSGGLEIFNTRRTELQNRKDEIERELSRQSAGYYVAPKAYNVDDVRSVMPSDAALVEYALVKPQFESKASPQESQYVAYIIRSEGPTAFVRLGSAAVIDSAVARLRRSLHSPASADFEWAARKVNDLVLNPVRSKAGSSKHLLISPEGSLSVIPFEALVDSRGTFAVQSLSFTYLTSGRDLFRLEEHPAHGDSPVVVADPNFTKGSPSTNSALASASTTTRRAPVSVTTGKNLSEVYFAPLAGSALEARNIKHIFPNAKLLTRDAATVNALRELNAPEILHLSTHGYFLEDGNAQRSAGKRGVLPPPATNNPLVRSGLAFAGANDRKSEMDDGLLTAMEATGLNLWGTKLVVLSACDTGLGEIRNGEGVYGLRRSFVLAGAETLVMSLWPVSDLVTRELMTGYYKNLKAGMGRGEALRQVQLAMIKRPTRRHPFYWASFIQSGEWANLDGKR